eukprot:9309248-Ditylum_brightwellii.AAC.1
MSIRESWSFSQAMILDEKTENDITVYDFLKMTNPKENEEELDKEDSSDDEDDVEVIKGIELVGKKRRGYKKFGAPEDEISLEKNIDKAKPNQKPPSEPNHTEDR